MHIGVAVLVLVLVSAITTISAASWPGYPGTRVPLATGG